MECKRCAGQVTVDDLICGTCGRLNEKSRAQQQSPEKTRAQVLGVVLRQAASNDEWRRLCDLAMQVNNITDLDVQAEAKKQKVKILPALNPSAPIPTANSQWTPGASESGTYPTIKGSSVDRLKAVYAKLSALAHQTDETAETMRIKLTVLCTELERCIVAVQVDIRASGSGAAAGAATDR
ncbi:MAG TPA: hypothetical protein V6C69_15345 [Trichormus sp.]|jgi:hypothetical protein